ncbi:MAG TPA: hypothetical protein VGR71_05050 [Nitrospira sp.]|nr:hypothetical protein [Nitrospira sp.]
MADSLLIAGEIELLGSQAVSTNPLCPGAVFMLGQGFDLGAPQPTTDFVASLLLDGERPFGRRSANRTISLPVTIQAPNRAILAAAREVLEQAVDQPYWLLTWTRDPGLGGTPLPLVLDCFRANATAPEYNTRYEKQGELLQLTLNFTALPYGRSDIQQQLSFASPVSSAQVPPPPPAPVVLDSFTTINSTQCAQSTVHIVGPNSCFWDPVAFPANDPQGLSTAFTYSAALPSPVNLTGMASIQKWIGFGSRYYYNLHHHAGKHRVRIDFTLTDTSGNSISFSRANLSLPVTEDPHNPAFSRVTLAIPQNALGSNGTPFNYASVGSYGFTITNRQSNPCLRYVCCYIDSITAYPSSQTSNPVTRGNLYNVYGVIGTVHTPVSLQFQQPPTASTPTTITAVGAGTYTVPLGTVYLKVEVVGGGGAGASQTLSGEGGGGGGAEYARENVFPCMPGQVIPYVVGNGGTSGSTPSDGGATAFGPAPGSTLIVTAFGGKSALQNSTIGGLGGQGSTNSVHFPGGPGRTATGSVGGGGGSSGGNASPGLTPTGTQSVVFNSPGSNTWLCPAGVFQVFVGVIGAGGGGASGGFQNGSGGGGAEYCGAYLNVTPGNSYPYTVGTGGNGGSGNDVNGQAGSGSSFTGDNGTISANGGGGGFHAFSGHAGQGGSGTFSSLLGFTEFPGGNGGGASPYSGGGGSSAGPGASGNNGDGYGDAGNAPTGGGSGGNGSGANGSANGQSGSSPGGGGGGTYGATTAGNGASGQVSIAYPGGAPTNNGASAVPGGGSGAQGGGSNNTPGSSGAQPGGAGGGADSAGSSVAGGNGGPGWIIITPYINAAFNTLIVHRPAYGSANTFVPVVPINGSNGATATMPVPVTNVNATFDGTYTAILTANTWNNPSASRNLSVTVTQYEYVGSAGYPQSTPTVAVVPNTQITNGIVVLGTITLPLKAVAPGNTNAFYTVTVNDSNGSDTFYDVILLDTMGQTVIINIPQVSVSTPGIPSSGGSVTNTTGYPVTVAISGGTVTNVSVAGSTVGSGDGTYTVLNNQSIAITYSAAPSWVWNAIEGYINYYLDEPKPDTDIGYILGSNAGRSSAVSVLDKCQVISGGSLSLEPHDNVLFAYCMEGPPLIGGSCYPRWYFDRLQ